MYGMNLRTWRRDPFVQVNYSNRELDELQRDLDELAQDRRLGTVDWGLRQVVFERSR